MVSRLLSIVVGRVNRLLSSGVVAVASAWALASPAAVSAKGAVMTYQGPCDASAAAALDAAHFVVANDESDALLIYRSGEAKRVGSVDVGRYLGTGTKEESDIEGAATIGSRVYWITSHSRNTDGLPQPSRHRVFATDIVSGADPRVIPVGTPYRDLLQDFIAAPSLAGWNLAEAATRAPEAEGGLNIEGLAATPEGGLLVGFRNPLREGRALAVPIQNPADVIAGKRPQLGTPIALDLGKRGIRGLALVGSVYYIAAGPAAGSGTFALFRWSGRATDAPTQVVVDLGNLRPEALFTIPGTGDIVLLSDDGGIVVDGRECKKRKHSEQTFRAMTYSP